MSFTLYNKAGEESHLDWQVDVNEMLASGEWFLNKKENKKSDSKSSKKDQTKKEHADG